MGLVLWVFLSYDMLLLFHRLDSFPYICDDIKHYLSSTSCFVCILQVYFSFVCLCFPPTPPPPPYSLLCCVFQILSLLQWLLILCCQVILKHRCPLFDRLHPREVSWKETPAVRLRRSFLLDSFSWGGSLWSFAWRLENKFQVSQSWARWVRGRGSLMRQDVDLTVHCEDVLLVLLILVFYPTLNFF